MAKTTVSVHCDTTAIEKAVEWACENLSADKAERLYALVADESIEMEEGKEVDGRFLMTLTLTPEVLRAFKDAGYDG